MEEGWFGGKAAGWVHLIGNSYQAVVCKGIPSQCFCSTEYGSLQAAKDAAEKWRYAKSTEMGLTKNMLKIEYDNNIPFVLVKLQKNFIMKCDIELKQIVEDSIWTAWKGQDKKVYYARRRASVKKNQNYTMFHRLVCPDFIQVDHINRDGLDNRRENLREGVECNPKNKGIQINNTSGIAGVYSHNNLFVAQICGGKQRKRTSFSINSYGYEKAKQMAIDQRNKWMIELRYTPN